MGASYATTSKPSAVVPNHAAAEGEVAIHLGKFFEGLDRLKGRHLADWVEAHIQGDIDAYRHWHKAQEVEQIAENLYRSVTGERS